MTLAAMNLNQLVALDALLAERHVGRAAGRMGVTQSAMSHTLRSLRELVGDPLLVRVGNTMVLTPFAEDARARLRRGLRDLESVVSGRAAFDPATNSDTFTLAAHDGVAAMVAGPLYAELRRRAPQAKLRIQPVLSDGLVGQLGEGGVDVALVPAGMGEDVLRSESVGTASVSVVCRSDHPIVRKRLTLAQYCKVPHAMLTLSGEGPSFIDALLAERGLTREVHYRVPFLLAFIEVIASSELLGTVPNGIADFFCQSWAVKRFPLPMKIGSAPLLQCWHPRFDADPAQCFFREVVRTATALTSRGGQPALQSVAARREALRG